MYFFNTVLHGVLKKLKNLAIAQQKWKDPVLSWHLDRIPLAETKQKAEFSDVMKKI